MNSFSSRKFWKGHLVVSLVSGCLFLASMMFLSKTEANSSSTKAQDFSSTSSRKSNIVPSREIPTPTYHPAVEGNPKKVRERLLGRLLKAKQFDIFEEEFVKSPDSQWATACGWAQYENGNRAEARRWF